MKKIVITGIIMVLLGCSPARTPEPVIQVDQTSSYKSSQSDNNYRNSSYQSSDYRSNSYQSSDYQNNDYRSSSYQSDDYQSRKNKTYASSDRTARCIFLTWGPDACGMAWDMIEGGDTPDILSSPLCGAALSKLADEPFSQEDLAIAAMTGGLDDWGDKLLDEGGFWKALGGIAVKVSSQAIKYDIFQKCLRK